MALSERHFQRTPAQNSRQQAASFDRNQLALVNRGRPTNVATDTGTALQSTGIANGIASGRLTPGQTSRLEGREAGLNREVHAERQANGAC